MGLESLLTRLEARTSGTSAKTANVPVKPACLLAYTSGTPRTSQKTVTGTKCENPAIQDEKLLELNSLIQYVAKENDFSEFDREEAKFYANKDVELALTSFRALARDIRRDRALELLQANPDVPRALYTDTESDPNNVILAIAVRHVAVTEMTVPRVKYDPWKLITILDGEVH